MKEQIINWAKKSMEEIGGKKAIIGISGGKDSTIVAKIFVEALGKENVVGVLMPNGVQKDVVDSFRVVDLLGIRFISINIKSAVDSIYEAIGSELNGINLTAVTTQNTPPRVRMTALYAIAGSIPGGRVINTSNLSEYYTGWCTKWGDMCGDLYPLLNLTKSEVVELGLLLGDNFSGEQLRDWVKLVTKVPEDGLTGKSDEENLGISYEVLDTYLTAIRDVESIADRKAAIRDISLEDTFLIESRHAAARHKMCKGPVFRPKSSNI